MCVIIYQPSADAYIEDEKLEAYHKRNSDGFGIFYPAGNGRVKMKRWPDIEKDQMLEEYHKHAGRALGMHFRLATHGEVSLENTHPYRILSLREDGLDLVMAHNGVFTLPQKKKERSDTWHLIEYFLRPILKQDPELIFDEKFQEYFGKLISGNNKLLFMDGKGRTAIINRAGGWDLDSGVWVSNKIGLATTYGTHTDTYYRHGTQGYRAPFNTNGQKNGTKPTETRKNGFVLVTGNKGTDIWLPIAGAIQLGYVLDAGGNHIVDSNVDTNKEAKEEQVSKGEVVPFEAKPQPPQKPSAQQIADRSKELFRTLSKWTPPEDTKKEDEHVTLAPTIAGWLYELNETELEEFCEEKPHYAALFLGHQYGMTSETDIHTLNLFVRENPKEGAQELIRSLYEGAR